MKSTVIRCERVVWKEPTYVKSVARDKSNFSITFDKAKARRFTKETAQQLCAVLPRNARTMMTFSTIEAA